MKSFVVGKNQPVASDDEEKKKKKQEEKEKEKVSDWKQH